MGFSTKNPPKPHAMEVEEELYLQGQLLWAQVSPACWRVSQHLALVEIRGEIKLTTDCQHGVFSHGRKAAGHPASEGPLAAVLRWFLITAWLLFCKLRPRGGWQEWKLAAVVCQTPPKVNPDVYSASSHSQLWLPWHILQDVSGVNICSQQLADVISCFWSLRRTCGTRTSPCLCMISDPWGWDNQWGTLSWGSPLSRRWDLVSHHVAFTSTSCRCFSPVLCPSQWSSSTIYSWAAGPWVELSCLSSPHSQRKAFCPGCEIVLGVYSVLLYFLSILLGTGQQTCPQHAASLPLLLVVQAQNWHLCFSLIIAVHLTASH